ncbi:MAG: TetR/AcrR family transcriptional regulator [Pseudomonadota bacterium]
MTKPDAVTQMPPAAKKEAYHHGDLRAELVAATRRLVEEKGPVGFSVAEAARAAGVSSAAPYRHFADRTAMLHAVALDGMERMSASFDAATAPLETGSVKAITELGKAYVRFAVAEPGLFRVMFAEHEDQPETLVQEGANCFGRLLAQVGAYLGLPPDDPAVNEVAIPLWIFVHGAAFLTIDSKLKEKTHDITADDMIETATARLLGPRPAA